LKGAGDPSPATATNRRLRAAQGSESAPSCSEPEVLLDEAIALFGSRYRRTISREEARQMVVRLTAFFDLLAEWQSRAQDGPVEGEVAA